MEIRFTMKAYIKLIVFSALLYLHWNSFEKKEIKK